MTIVRGLDQYRAQITAEWLDTATGELSRRRIAPADRSPVPTFAAPFRGQLEAALEATTGWRFMAEELAGSSAGTFTLPSRRRRSVSGKPKGRQERPRRRGHLRELLMVGRLPESWIPPEHLLELRARVRLRHTLVDQRGSSGCKVVAHSWVGA